MSKIVIALGGNALGDTPQEQKKLTEFVAESIVGLVEMGHTVVVAHGNGPQVGMIKKGLEYASENTVIKASMPLPECGAMSQGYIGYQLQNSIDNELVKRNLSGRAVSIVTQVVVDEGDKAFQNPTKPIGSYYSKDQAEKMMSELGVSMVEDSGRGYRQVVASPKPIDVVEKDIIRGVAEAGNVVIAVGGGGIPVVLKAGVLCGVPAVIDKDLAAEKLAECLNADVLIILTAVERVAVNFGKPDQRWISSMTVSEAAEYICQNQFAPGSMLPKVQASMAFARHGGTAVIAALEKAREAIEGNSGTKIING